MEKITRKEAKAKGLKHYFTGKECKNGHVDRRHTSAGTCCTCRLERTRQKRADGYIEVERARYRDKYATDPEFRKKELEKAAKYTRDNRAHRTAYEARRKARIRSENELCQLQQSIESARDELLHLQQAQAS